MRTPHGMLKAIEARLRSNPASHRTPGPMGRILMMLLAALMAVAGIVTVMSPASAAPNPRIVVDGITLSWDGEGQVEIGDTLRLDGTWDASDAEPVEGDTFYVGLPPELRFDTAIPFDLLGADGEIWGSCLTDPASAQALCTLNDRVEDWDGARGTFFFEVTANQRTEANEVTVDANGEGRPVVVPGEGGIGDGIELPGEVSKSGVMNGNNWSMTWTVDVPGANMSGQDTVTITDTLGAGHVLCEQPGFKVETVRGDTVNDVTGIATFDGEPGDTQFGIVLTAPQGGFAADVTYRITYRTCTPDGRIDEAGTTYDNSAQVEGWGEAGVGIGQVTNRPWQLGINKSGSVLGGAERNGKIRWTIEVPGSKLLGKDGFTLADTLGGEHALCEDTVSGIRVFERYGPSNDRRTNITDQLIATPGASTDTSFAVDFAIADGSDLQFKDSDWRYVIEYTTCATADGLPEGGTPFTNAASIDGEVATGGTQVPGRAEGKGGSINGETVVIGDEDYLPQTTVNWNVRIPGEKLADLDEALTITDQLSSTHQVCEGGESVAESLRLRVRAIDQINNGGLATVDLTSSTQAGYDPETGTITFTLDPADGFSREYQYLIEYTTCTTSGGMDAPGTVYSNEVSFSTIVWNNSVTQNNRAGGTGQGVTRGSVAISKDLSTTAGAQFVPAGTEFAVHVAEVDPAGVTQNEYDLRVPLDGTPASGFTPRGAGWTFELSEPTFPSIPGVVFGAPVFAETSGVTPSEDGTTAVATVTPRTNIAVQLTNTAQLGSLSVLKEIEGAAAGLVDADQEFMMNASIDVSALGEGFPAQDDRQFAITAGEPYQLDDLPIGAVVTFSETVPADDDVLTWGPARITPETIEVTADHVNAPATITVTNSVERTVGTFSISKDVTGAQADNPAVPANVEVTATWTEEGGTEQSKVLNLPTDGTPVPFDEQLLIGTRVTLTETPLEDGSSIAWGTPVWSGDGVSVDGTSAVVTVGRDAEAHVTVENHAATSTAGLSLLKGVAGEAAGEVGDDAEFPVTVTWTDAEGEEQTRELTINAREPVELGEDLPAGTVVTITEGDAPAIDTVIWDAITIGGDDVTDNGDGSATVVVSDQQSEVTLVTITNEATWAPGTFSLSKELTGVSPEHGDVPETFTVIASWLDEEGAEQAKELTVPVDGTTVSLGEDLPHGTEVALSEVRPDDSASFTWNRPVWTGDRVTTHDDGTAVVVIGAADDVAVDLANSVTALTGSVELIKALDGKSADDVPAGASFPVRVSWTDLHGEEQHQDTEITAGTPVVIDGVLLGTEVTLTESATEAALPGNVLWSGVQWSSDDVTVTVDDDAKSSSITIVGEDGARAEVTLTNTFDDLGTIPNAGAPDGALWLVLAGLVALAAGGGLMAQRSRRH
ncbi:LPXTG cell wall anchor domain-containing protein [Aeromicrobium sp. YIM 150415]|uniref:DUF5979 domain-containing protein n=1 Tax=Aeromicrobium sp. YIM 150415 TaxID=2803912 RepID=UPI0019642C49|nr:DUF5979 domain-containing protein [Aeromicrobium sp. YIM 150415]MBM9465469.1 LPXTG cell wall anchor domain-containing protein [Aeromicrobium sp. YIM 150415]